MPLTDQPLYGMLVSLANCAKNSLEVSAPVVLKSRLVLESLKGVVEVSQTGACRYYATVDDWKAGLLSDEIVASCYNDAILFIAINLDR